jgi:hypothetical protein
MPRSCAVDEKCHSLLLLLLLVSLFFRRKKTAVKRPLHFYTWQLVAHSVLLLHIWSSAKRSISFNHPLTHTLTRTLLFSSFSSLTPPSKVVRFDRRVPMRPRYRAAGDNPAWRSFVPQWTGEGGAHRVWKRKTAERAQLLHSFNQTVGAAAEKPPELDAGAI